MKPIQAIPRTATWIVFSVLILLLNSAHLAHGQPFFFWQHVSSQPGSSGCNTFEVYQKMFSDENGEQHATGQFYSGESFVSCSDESCGQGGESVGTPSLFELPPLPQFIPEMYPLLGGEPQGCTDCGDAGSGGDPWYWFNEIDINNNGGSGNPILPPPLLSNIAEQVASLGFPSLSLGQNSYGSAIGSLVVTPDLTADPSLPLNLYDLDRVVNRLVDILQIPRIILPDTTEGYNVHQFVTEHVVVQAEQIAGGGLRLRTFTKEGLTQVAGQSYYSIPPAIVPLSDMTATKETQDDLPGIRMVGLAQGRGFNGFFGRVVQAGVGSVTTTEDNKQKKTVVDAYQPDPLDFDGYARVRSTAEFRKDQASGLWVQTSERVTTSRTLINGWEVPVHEVVALTGGDSVWSEYEYDEQVVLAETLNKSYGKLLVRKNSDGSWVRHQYDADGRLYKTLKPWLNEPAQPSLATDSNCHVETITFFPENSPWTGESHVVTTIGGVIVGEILKTVVQETGSSGPTPFFVHTTTEKSKRLNAASEAVVDLVLSTERRYEREGTRPTLRHTLTPDGKMSTTEERKVKLENGAFIADANGDHTESIRLSRLSSEGDCLAGVTARNRSVRNPAGQEVFQVSEVASSSGAPAMTSFIAINGVRREYDTHGRVSRELLLGGEVEKEWVYNQDGEDGRFVSELVKDRSGVRRTRVTDTLAKIVESRVDGLDGVVGAPLGSPFDDGPYVMPSFRESSFLFPGGPGLTLEVAVSQGDDHAVQTQSTLRDAAGRVVHEIDAAGLITSRQYAGMSETVVLPGGATRVTSRHRDGQIASVTGSAVIPEYFTRVINPDGTLTETRWVGSLNSPRWRRTLKDFSGRVLREEAPNPENPTTTARTKYFYDDEGRLVRVAGAGVADQLSVYDATTGQLTARGMDLDGNGTLDLAGTDRVTTVSPSSVQQADGKWWQVSSQTVLTQDGSSTVGLTTSDWVELRAGARAARRRFLPDGTQVETTVETELGSSLRVVTTVTTRPDNSVAQVKEYYVAGRLAGRQDLATGTLSKWYYDGLGRLTWSRDVSRHGTRGWESRNYHSATGQLVGLGVNGKLRSFEYYPASHPNAGRLWKEKSSLNHDTPSEVVFEYDSQGRERRQTGSGGYPVEKTYDPYGHLYQMKTWRDAQGAPDVTTWIYTAATGTLSLKKDAQDRLVIYTYDPAGRIKTRKGSRNVVTTYGYAPSGELQTVSYSDSTPGVIHVRDRAGRMLETTDGSGVRSMGYDALVAADTGTTYEEGPLAGWEVKKPRDAAGRVAGWQVKQGTAVKASSSWGYLVGSDHLATVSLDAHSVTYGRLDVKSGHANPAAFLSENGTPSSLSYSGAGLTLLRDESMSEATPTSHPASTYYSSASGLAQGAAPLLDQFAGRNEDGQMTNAVRTWNGDMSDRSLQDYGYNSRKEVVQASATSQEGALLPGRGFRYAYDALGNRTAASVSTLGADKQAWLADTPGTSQTTGYPSTNSLNQYETVQRPNPLKKLVQGLAHPDSTVTVTLVGGPGNGTLPPVSTLRWGPGMTAFAAEAVVEMVPQAGWRRVRVDAVRPGAGAAGANLRTVREGWLYFPPAVETLAYDLDGNLISDARWSYGWDGENRLIWMEEKVIPGGGIRPARQRLEFGYDGQSRRVVKRVLQKVSESSSWSLRQERRFLYDGWNMIAELDVPSSGAARVHRAYAWGLDASGTLTGAGGVGGLLLTSHHTPQGDGGTQVTTLAPLYDFNGNVLAYADVATSTITHRMEYDPFGQELSLDTLLPGEGAVEAPRFRFSTKYTDGETGLVYYGYRSYSPELGRWPSRDPIEERGGLNLYGMVGNDAVNSWDYLGLKTKKVLWVTRTNLFATGRFDGDRDYITLLIDTVRELANEMSIEDVQSKSEGRPTHYIDDGDTVSFAPADSNQGYLNAAKNADLVILIEHCGILPGTQGREGGITSPDYPGEVYSLTSIFGEYAGKVMVGGCCTTLLGSQGLGGFAGCATLDMILPHAKAATKSFLFDGGCPNDSGGK